MKHSPTHTNASPGAHLAQILIRLAGAFAVCASLASHAVAQLPGASQQVPSRQAEENPVSRTSDPSAPSRVVIDSNADDFELILLFRRIVRKINSAAADYLSQHGIKPAHGKATVRLTLNANGSIYEAEGGPKVAVSSGSPGFDAAVIKAIREAAPFGDFRTHARGGRREIFDIVVPVEF